MSFSKLNDGDFYLDDFQYFVCPNCHETTDSIVGGESGFECFSCGGTHKKDEWGKVTEETHHTECDCGWKVNLTSENRAGDGLYMCPSCMSIVAVEYESEYLNPIEIIQDKGEEEYITSPLTEEQKKIAKLLSTEAGDERSEFISYNSDQNAIIYSDGGGFYCGYLFWSVFQGEQKLSQIWIHKNKRRRGIASDIIQFWCEDIIPDESSFLIESPNDDMMELIHHLESDGRIYGKSFQTISSMM